MSSMNPNQTDSGNAIATQLSGSTAQPRFPTLDGNPPDVIGHRGDPSERPEHTLEGYRLAIERGADLIEPDLVVTKDGYLLDRHEPLLSGTTDVADHPEFANRQVTKVLEGDSVTDWWAEDFTLAELKTLYAKERIPQLRPDNTQYNGQYRIPELSEIIDLVKQVEAETGKKIAIIPEIKHPTYFKYNGTYSDGTPIHVDTSQVLIDTLVANDFTNPARVSIQSFEIANLIELQTEIMPAAGVDLPLVQLLFNSYAPDLVFHLDPANAPLGANPSLYDGFGFPLTSTTVPTVGGGGLYSAEAIQAMASLYADVISPYKEDIYPATKLPTPLDIDGDGAALLSAQLTGEEVPVVDRAHAAGIEAVVYTLRNEEYFSSLNPDGTVQRPVEEYLKVIATGFDGFFTDSPATGREIVDQLAAGDRAIAAANFQGGNDIVVYDAAGLVAAKGSGGADTAIFGGDGALVLPATVENAELRGAADVSVTGNALDNRIVGNAGGNVLRGGTGTDVVTGGAGADTFVFSPGENLTITDFGANGDHDRIDLSAVRGQLGDVTLRFLAEGVSATLGSGETLTVSGQGVTDAVRGFADTLGLAPEQLVGQALHLTGLAGLAAPQSGGAGRAVVAGLEFLGSVSLSPDTTFEGVTVGGLSGLTFDASTGTFYAISDDRSPDARFYKLGIGVGDGALTDGDVTITGVQTPAPIRRLSLRQPVARPGRHRAGAGRQPVHLLRR